MDAELALVLGIVLAVGAVPSILSAFSEGRTPRVAWVVVLVAVCLIVWALVVTRGGFTLPDIPRVFVRVLARFMP